MAKKMKNIQNKLCFKNISDLTVKQSKVNIILNILRKIKLKDT